MSSSWPLTETGESLSNNHPRVGCLGLSVGGQDHRHVTKNPEGSVTKLRTSSSQSVPLAICDKAAGKAIQPVLLIQLLQEPHDGCSSRPSL